MVSKLTDTTFSTTYKDDFRDSDNYHRILFNSGRALQARELTQMQTIIQKEIERFANNVFRTGSQVNPAGLTLNTNMEFVKLAGNPDVSDFAVGQTITESTTGISGRITRIEPYIDVENPATFYINYTNTSGGTTGDAFGDREQSVRFTSGATLTNGNGTAVTVQTTDTELNAAVGIGSSVSVSTGSFYAAGHFVQCNPQTIMIDRYFAYPTTMIGFKVVQQIVTADDEDALYDNQAVLPNETAPGADRYRIQLDLTTEYDLDADDNFVYLNTVIDGTFLDETEKTTYGIIGDELAKRTSEESGNYTVEPFNVEIEQNFTDSATLNIDIAEGIAYVGGYRYATEANTIIGLDRARETATIENDLVSATYGNYVQIDGTSVKGFPNVDTLEQINLYDDSSIRGTQIGTARVRSVEASGSNYNYYIFDTEMNSGQKFSSVRSMGTDSESFGNLILEYNIARLQETNNNDVFFPTQHTRPKSLDDISLTVQRRRTVTLDGSGVGTISLTALGESFTNTSSWIISRDSDGALITPDVTPTGSGTNSSTITHATSPNQSIEILTQVSKISQDGSLSRSKTSQETTVTAAIDSDGNGLRFIPLGKADILGVIRARTVDSDGTDVLPFYTLDNGQRDNFYDQGRLILNPSSAAPTDNIFVRFSYLSHGATGAFFSVNSYSEIDYGSIPQYTKSDGTVVQLRNVLDFRSRKDDTGSNFSAGTAVVNELPLNTSTIQADIEYYLPRKDLLVMTKGGNFMTVTGRSALNPKYQPVPENSLHLYSISLNPYTDDENDLNLTYIDNRGYTMSDIGTLEDRIERLEDFTTLSLLETDTSKIEVLDANGNNRFKTGFFADNFKDATYSDLGQTSVSFDVENQLVNPLQSTNPIRILFDSASSSNVRVLGDHLMLNYTDSAVIDQPFASEFENVNPFDVVSYFGTMELSPKRDYHATVNLSRAQRLVKKYYELKSPTSISTVIKIAPGKTIDDYEKNYEKQKTQILKEFNRITRGAFSIEAFAPTIETVNDAIGVKIPGHSHTGPKVYNIIKKFDFKNLTSGTFMRSRKVFFRARGLKPSTKYFAFFDDLGVDNWVKTETTFGRSSTKRTTKTDAKAVKYVNEHPEGAETLISSATGEIIGSLFIPHATFKGGTREFKLFDIEVNNISLATSGATATYSTRKKPKPRPNPKPPKPTPRPITPAPPSNPTPPTPKPEDPIVPNPPQKEERYYWNYYTRNKLLFSPIVGGGTAPSGGSWRLVGTRIGNAAGTDVPRSINNLGQGSDQWNPAGTLFGDYKRVRGSKVSSGKNNSGNPVTIGYKSSSVKKTSTPQSTRQASSTKTSVSLFSSNNSNTTSRSVATTPSRSRLSTSASLFGGLNDNRQCAFKDPLSQSFRLPNAMVSGGFVTEVDVFFATRPSDNIPVRMQIRPMVAGVPDKTFIAEVQVERDDVNIPGDLNSMSSVKASPTTFTFEEPVYLETNEDYAFTLIADTNQYNVFVSKVGEFELGSTVNRINRQPNLGSLFMSQNGVTWSPDQERDIMFTLRCAVFDETKSGVAIFNNDDLQPQVLNGTFGFDSGDSDVFVTHPNHGLMAGDTIVLEDIDSSGDFAGITGTSLQGNRTVVKVDGTGYTFKADSAATSTLAYSTDEFSVSGTRNIVFDEFTPIVDTFINDNVTIDFIANFTDGAGLSTANDAGNGAYTKSSRDYEVFTGETLLLESPAMIISESQEETKLGAGNHSFDVAATLTTINKYISPVIDLSTMSASLTTNMIDNQDSATETGILNVPINFVAETNPSGGSSLSKHVSQVITLAEPAVGIKILIDAHRSNNSFIDVYYKTLPSGSDASISDKNWVLVEEETNNPTDEDRNVFREYEYLAGGSSGTLDPFTSYQIKVVMRAGNSSRPPVLSSLRAITLGT